MEEIDSRLIPMRKEQAQIYSPGRYLIFTKNPKDLTKAYSQNDITIRKRDAPELSENMERIWQDRYIKKFPNGVKREGKFPGMTRPISTEGTLDLELFDSGYLDWQLTLPQGDEYDSMLEAKCMRPFFCIHHIPITLDNKIIYALRSNNRASWAGNYLFTHSWGEDIDKNYAHDILMKKLVEGQGKEMFEQAKQGMRREMNPYEDNKNPDKPNKMLAELLMPDDVIVKSASCLTLAAMPRDVGYHLCFTARINYEAGEFIEQRRKYPYNGRITEYYSENLNEDFMIKFFKEFKDKIALTVEPALIMACVQKFGEDFLYKLPYEMKIKGRRKLKGIAKIKPKKKSFNR